MEWSYLFTANRATGVRTEPRIDAGNMVVVIASGQHSNGLAVLEVRQAHRASSDVVVAVLDDSLAVGSSRGEQLHRRDLRAARHTGLCQLQASWRWPVDGTIAVSAAAARHGNAAVERQQQGGRHDTEKSEQDVGDEICSLHGRKLEQRINCGVDHKIH
ncbi:hypothetical protein Cni_G27475 [Canna indica]|uniref:Uncharacterized protein n=1 Tax=Canna indica TaxID=4628 RepID=A0AAQ3L0U8_9LILI|nr:hypothetical protein Cni_G27475 [Canna indica]